MTLIEENIKTVINFTNPEDIKIGEMFMSKFLGQFMQKIKQQEIKNLVQRKKIVTACL